MIRLGDLPGAVKAPADLASYAITVGTVTQLLPHVAALLTIIWWTIRILETETVRAWLRRRRDRR
jgi:hypothetical protein